MEEPADQLADKTKFKSLITPSHYGVLNTPIDTDANTVLAVRGGSMVRH